MNTIIFIGKAESTVKVNKFGIGKFTFIHTPTKSIKTKYLVVSKHGQSNFLSKYLNSGDLICIEGTIKDYSPNTIYADKITFLNSLT